MAADNIVTRTMLLEMFQAGEIDAVEDWFAGLQARALAGEVDPEDERDSYGVFEATHPDIAPFVAKWSETYPDSAYAHTAQGWLYLSAARLVRGSKPGSHTHPFAHAAFRDFIGASVVHADAAVAADPDLLPAAELVLRLVHHINDPLRHERVLKRLMETRPNERSMKFALLAAHRGWGGSRRWGDYLCDTYADAVPEWQPDPVTLCKTYVGFEFYLDDMGAADVALLDRFDHPLLDGARFEAVLYGPADDRRDWAEALGDHVRSDPEAHDRFVDGYNNRLTYRFDLPPAYEEVGLNRVAWARARAAIDPFNPDVVRGLMADRDLPASERVALHARLLRVRPYDSDLWLNHGKRLAQLKFESPDRFFAHRGPIKFAAALSDAPGWIIGEMMMIEIDAIATLEGERELRPEMLPPEWHAFLDGMDRENDYICPAIRAGRFYDRMCADDARAVGCSPAERGMQQGILKRLQAQAKDERLCYHERLAPLEDLSYTFEEAMAEPGMAELLGE
ncbi:MAG: DUF4034 domain-containing protein [Paracoccaceae bacterium]|nr:DUF4034 domain-containing protein [Paracoccaceae bacterium]